MSDSNKNLHEIRFLPPCGREDPANAFAALALRGNRIFPLALSSAPKRALIRFKSHWGDLPRPDAVRRAGRVDVRSFYEIRGMEVV